MRNSKRILKPSKTKYSLGKHPNNLMPYKIIPRYGIGAPPRGQRHSFCVRACAQTTATAAPDCNTSSSSSSIASRRWSRVNPALAVAVGKMFHALQQEHSSRYHRYCCLPHTTCILVIAISPKYHYIIVTVVYLVYCITAVCVVIL